MYLRLYKGILKIVLRKVILSQILITMLASCGVASTGGSSQLGVMQNAKIEAEDFAHAQKSDKPSQSVTAPDSSGKSITIAVDDIVLKSAIDDSKKPVFDSVKMPYTAPSIFSYKGDQDVEISEFKTGAHNTFDLSTGDGTLYVKPVRSYLLFDKESTINIHLTDKGGARIDNDSFDTARLHVILESTLQLQLQLQLQSAAEQLSSKLNPEDVSKFQNIFSSMDSTTSSAELVSTLKTALVQATSIFDELSLKYSSSDTKKLLTEFRTSIPLLQSMFNILSKTSLSPQNDPSIKLKTIVDGLKPLVQVEGKLSLNGKVKVDKTKSLSAKTLYKIMDCTGITIGSPSLSTEGLKIFGANGNNDIESADIAMLVISDDSGSYTFLLTLKDIGMTAPYMSASTSTPNFLRTSGGSVGDFLRALQTGVSFDPNAQVFKTGNIAMTVSNDSLNGVDNLIGFSYQNSPSSIYGMYAKYNLAQKAQIDNFATYIMSSVGKFKIFNTLSYQGLEDKNEDALIASKSQTSS